MVLEHEEGRELSRTLLYGCTDLLIYVLSEGMMSRGARSALFVIGLILLIAVGGIAAALIKNVREAAAPVVAVTFSDIADHDGDKVSIEGLIEFGRRVQCNDSGTVCNLFLEPVDGSHTPDLEVILWVAQMEYDEEREPNKFYLPVLFDPDDFRIYTDSGQELTRHDPVRVTGMVDHINVEDGRTDVYVDVSKVEAAGQ